MKLLLIFALVALAAAQEKIKKSLRDDILEKKGLAESAGQKSGETKQGDMRVGKHQSGGSDRNMITGDQYRWPKKSDGFVYVPYTMASNVIPAAKPFIEASIKDYARYTCIKWVPRTSEQDYIEIFREDGCWSYVGKQGGKQQLSLGDGCQYDKGTPTHEMMHALGFEHEQSRSDRDKFVQIVEANVEKANMYNFDVCPDTKCTLPKSPYDFQSVMHYESFAFSINRQDTIVPRQSAGNIKLGQRKGLSKGDIAKLNEMYKCNGKTVERYNNGGVYPADEKVDGWSNCPKFQKQCANPTDNYNILTTCEKTCAGVKKGDPYDKYTNCGDFASMCSQSDVKADCGATCAASG